jgi:hypothetical protein
MTDEKLVTIRLSEKELRYVIACGIALMQNVPKEALSTYCGLSHEEIVEFSRKMKRVADESGVDM